MSDKTKLLVSISGGRTSAVMSFMLWKQFKEEYDMIFVFANTSLEEEETLLFLHQIETIWKIPIVWVEAIVHHGQRKGCTHKIVDYKTACRDGSVFEEVIKKYGIPNASFPHCTREMKTNPIKSYARSIGWATYLTAIGYRADEMKRVNWEKAEKKKQWYPLVETNIKKQDVFNFMSKQSFDLQLADFDGNCQLCHKKSKRKQLTQLKQKPERANWYIDMEAKYEKHITPAKRGLVEESPLRFFREYESIHDLIEESKLPFEESVDRSKDINDYTSLVNFDNYLDSEGDCGGSCEPF